MLKWILIGAGVLVVLVVAALLALPLLVDTPAIQAYVSQAASHALGRPVKFTALSVSALPLPTVKLRGLQVAEDPAFGPGPFLSVGEGRLGIRLGPLLQGRVEMADLTLDGARIHVVEDGTGRLNVATLGGAGAALGGPSRGGPARPGAPATSAVLLSRVRIVNSAVAYQKAGTKTADFSLDRINATVAQAGPGEAIRISGVAVGQPGNVRLTISDGTVDVAGSRGFAEAPLTATVEVEAKDVAGLVGPFLPSPQLSGPLKGRIQVSGTMARLVATGALSLDRLAVSAEQPHCPDPKRRSLVLEAIHLPLAFTPAQLESQPVQGKVAGGTVALRLMVALKPARVATLKDITVKGVQLEPVLVDYACQRNAVTGPLDLTGEAGLRPPDALRTLNGSGRLRIGPGRVVGPDLLKAVNQVTALTDVVSALRPEAPGRARAGSPLNFDSITATYTMTDGVVRTDDLLYQAPDLRVTAAGTYGLADGRTAMDVTLTQGSNRVRARLTGTAGALRIVPTDVRLQEPKDFRKMLDRLLR